MSNILIRNQNMNAFLRNGVWSLFIIFILGLKMSTHKNKTKQNETTPTDQYCFIKTSDHTLLLASWGHLLEVLLLNKQSNVLASKASYSLSYFN